MNYLQGLNRILAARNLLAVTAEGVTGDQDTGGDGGSGGDPGDAGGEAGDKDTEGAKSGDGEGSGESGGGAGDNDSILGGKNKDGEQTGDKPGDSEGETGELEIQVPEGMTLGDEELAAFKTFATEAGFSSEQASAALSYHKQLQEKAFEHWQAEDKGWQEEIAKDKKYGGDNLATTVLHARAAVDIGGHGDAVRSVLQGAGCQNHPVLVRWAADIGAKFAEDNSGGGGGGGGPRSRKQAADDFYNNPSGGRR